jgi:heterodisulfide reductase subunit C
MLGLEQQLKSAFFWGGMTRESTSSLVGLKVMTMSGISSDLEFRKWILQQPEGKTLLRCYQCGRCTSACPIAAIDDSFNPRLFLEKIILADDSLAEEQLIWTCLTCEQCEVRCPEHVKIPEILVLAKVRGLASGNTPQTALDRARAILSQGRVILVSEPMLKTRDKMGLPNIGTPPIKQLTRILKELGTAERVESAESRYGGDGDE